MYLGLFEETQYAEPAFKCEGKEAFDAHCHAILYSYQNYLQCRCSLIRTTQELIHKCKQIFMITECGIEIVHFSGRLNMTRLGVSND